MPHTPARRPATHQCLRLIFVLTLIGVPLKSPLASLSYDLDVELRPDSGEMTVTNTVTVDSPVERFEFVLNAGLAVDADNATLETLDRSRDGLRVAYRATPQAPTDRLTLRYRGRPVFSDRRSMGGMPQGEVSAQGVYLDAGSAWYPLFAEPVSAMRLAVELPDGWQSISVGRRSAGESRQEWATTQPHDSLYLLAAPYHRYARQQGPMDLSVWLLDDDPDLAERYLAVMGDYIDHYDALIGPYPYGKFAVVENRWQTGFGMPSFTLLGSRVIRLPFIPFTSLPHEILHNWWGNGVWVDYAEGNWSEGLTAYLADHWMQERRGKGHEYRLKALQRYTNFAAQGDDRPLREFVSRHNDASQSIGYSKSLMLFHMLRRELGDAAFTDGLRRLWHDPRFTAVGFDVALRSIIGDDPELVARALDWLAREGAPRLALDDVQVVPLDDAYRLDFTLHQQGPVFDLRVPVAVTLAGAETAEWHRVRVDDRSTRISLSLPSRPLRLDVDPAYDVLRYLDISEQPPALNRLFGGDTWLILPGDAGAAERAAWQALAERWQERYPRLRTVADRELGALPVDADRIVLGWDNRWRGAAARALARADQALGAQEATITGQSYARDSHAVVLVNNADDGRTTGFIGAPDAGAIAALARKLPHYGSYGRLVFDADGGRNLRKDSMGSDHSALSRQLGDDAVGLRLPGAPVLGQSQR
jgi:hypothetical protein